MDELNLEELGKDITKTIFSHLDPNIQKKILTKSVTYQGETITLKELLTPTCYIDFDEIIDSNLLSKLINNEVISVGAKLEPLNDHTRSVYLHRKFDYDEGTVSEEELCEYEDRRWSQIIRIWGSPGSGKTTFLDNITVAIKNRYPYFWVIKIDLNDYTQTLSQFKKDNVKPVTILDLLNSNPRSRIANDFERKIFSIRHKVVLMIDGLDEICTDFKYVVEDLMADYETSCNFAKVFTVSSKNIAKYEKAIQRRFMSYNLVGFSEEEKVELLERFVKGKLDKADITEKLVDDGVGEALQIRMLAEVVNQTLSEWESCYRFLNFNNRNESNVDIRKLYLLFIHKKWYKNKTTVDENKLRKDIAKFNKECYSYLYVVALEDTLNQDHCKLFECYKNHNEKIPEEVEKMLLQTGIVKNLNGNLRFFHRTVAEYFVTDCLIEELCNTENEEFLTFFIEIVLVKCEYSLIRLFFDGVIDSYIKYIRDETLKQIARISAENGNSVLYYLLKERHINTFNFILKCLEKAEIYIDIDVIRPEGKTLLHTAISADRFDLVKLLVRKGASVNSRDNEECTSLHDAVIKNNLIAVTFLIERGAEVHCKDINGRTPLHLANSVDIVAYLLKHGAIIDSKDKQGYTSLQNAVKNGHLEIVRCLVDHGANVNCEVKRVTPIFKAVAEGHLEIVKVLLEKGANLTFRNETCGTVLHKPMKSPYEKVKKLINEESLRNAVEIAKLLIQHGVDVNIINNKGDTALSSHIDVDDNIDLIKLFVENGANVKRVNKTGFSALDKAMQCGAFKIVKYLIEKDEDIPHRRDSILSAVRRGHLNVLKYVSENGINSNVKGEYGNSTLHEAVKANNLDMVKFLVEKGVEINAETVGMFGGLSGGMTPIAEAINNDNIDIVKFLVENRANINGKVEHATARGNMELVKYLEGQGAEAVKITNVGDNFELLKYFVEKGVQVDTSYIFHTAAMKGDLDIIRYLVKMGVDPNSEYNTRAALHQAAKYDQIQVVRFLVKHGADVNVKDFKGETPLDKAFRHGNSETAQFLIDNGADLNKRGPENLLNFYHEGMVYQHLKTKFSVERCETCDINAGDKDLFCASLKYGCFDVAEFLAKKTIGGGGTIVDIVNRYIGCKDEPFLSEVFERWDTVRYLLERGMKISAEEIDRLKEHVSNPNNPPILIFPEGTCINNTSVMQFKKGSFEVGSIIYPVAIKYDPRFGDAFWNSSRFSMVQYLYMMMTSWAIVCDVWYLPPMRQEEGETAIDFANRVKSVVANQGGLVDLVWDGQLKRVKAKKEWRERQQEEFSKRLKVE